MKIAVIHSRYRSAQPSGENVAVQAQIENLQAAGNEVFVYQKESDNIRESAHGLITTGLRVARNAGSNPDTWINEVDPDIVHVHNTFPNISTDFLDRCRVPLVATLHNFRHSCAAGTFYSDGQLCTECIDRGPSRAIAKRCYRNSRLATLPMAVGPSRGALRSKLVAKADRLVTMSGRAREMHIHAGISADSLALIPNFRPDSSARATFSRGKWIYIGRLSPEKGILDLAREWPEGHRLEIYGDGPLWGSIAAINNPDVHLNAPVPAERVDDLLQSATGVVFPSTWPESAFPMSYLDALCVGLPVLARRGNSAADDVEESGSGATFENSSDIHQAMAQIEVNWTSYATNSRVSYESKFTPQLWISAIEELYSEVIEGYGSKSGRPVTM
ncbi:putative glycosyltransferase [Gordonia rhizosphera NBRC 16068]|uniref:Putative glycosyltransferase n=1 Tax=Gordonia rhizosphera NBRC 16068 TaxID=1108045 RepID=K6VC19_9ACTN|nr:putative glycosyltransferase [Gordonia rhizosphera NBRC 16068]